MTLSLCTCHATATRANSNLGESRKNLPVESGTQLKESGIREIFAYGFQNLGLLKSGIQLKESGIPLTIEIRNPVSVIRNPRRRIQTLLDSFTWADNMLTKKIKH